MQCVKQQKYYMCTVLNTDSFHLNQENSLQTLSPKFYTRMLCKMHDRTRNLVKKTNNNSPPPQPRNVHLLVKKISYLNGLLVMLISYYHQNYKLIIRNKRTFTGYIQLLPVLKFQVMKYWQLTFFLSSLIQLILKLPCRVKCWWLEKL